MIRVAVPFRSDQRSISNEARLGVAKVILILRLMESLSPSASEIISVFIIFGTFSGKVPMKYLTRRSLISSRRWSHSANELTLLPSANCKSGGNAASGPSAHKVLSLPKRIRTKARDWNELFKKAF